MVHKFLMAGLLVVLTVGSQTGTADASGDQSGCVKRSDLIISSVKNTEQNRVLVAAHRGGHRNSPENSVASIHEAISVGVDIIELDVRLTSDGIPVLMHDKDVARTTTGEGLVSRMTWSEIQDLRLLHNGTPTNQTVPSLEEVLAVSCAQILVNLDLKIDLDNVEAVVKRVLESNAQSYTMYYNDDFKVLSKVRELYPAAIVMPLADDARQAKFYSDQFDLELVHLKPEYSNQQLAAHLNKNQTAGWVNSLGRVDALLQKGILTAADSLIADGADVIQTDAPAELLAILLERQLRPEYPEFVPSEFCHCSSQ